MIDNETQTIKGTLTTDTDGEPLFIREDGERFRLAEDERTDELLWCSEHTGEIFSSDRKYYINQYPVGGRRKDGHLQVSVFDERNDGWTMAKAHRLIARAWLKRTKNRTYVHHKDRNPSNNDSANLLWVDDYSGEHRKLHNLMRHNLMEEYRVMIAAIEADNETKGSR